MRALLICAALTLPGIAIPAAAQPYDRDYGSDDGYGYDNSANDELRQCREDLSQAADREEYRRELAECRDAEMRARDEEPRGYDFDDNDEPDDGYAGSYAPRGDYGGPYYAIPNGAPYGAYASPYGNGAGPNVPYDNGYYRNDYDLNTRDW